MEMCEDGILRKKKYLEIIKLKLLESGENFLRISYSLQKNHNDYIKKGKLRGTRCMCGIVRNITRFLWKSLREKT
jgi:hypothetical protein